MSKLNTTKFAAAQFLNHYKTAGPGIFAAAQQVVGGILIADGFVGTRGPSGTKRNGIIASLMCIVVGLLFTFGGFIFPQLFGVNHMTATTQAAVIQVKKTTSTNKDTEACYIEASYDVNGTQYTGKSSISTNSACALTTGQNITISYNPDDPSAWAYDAQSTKTIVTFLPLIGALIALASLYTFITQLMIVLFGWRLVVRGRTLAKTVPGGANLSDFIAKARGDFINHLFSFDPRAHNQKSSRLS